MKKKLKIFLWVDIVIIFALAFYKVYLFAFERDYESLNPKSVQTIVNENDNSKNISFAVVGNIENSIDIFDKKIVTDINNDKNINFVVSSGNAVMDGAEDKYRIFKRSINKLNVPLITGVGEKEISDNGAFRYYKHFGPLYYAFHTKDSYFIFLDTTEQTSLEWQKKWLLDQLNNSSQYQHRFVFLNKPPFIIKQKSLIERKNQYIISKNFREFLVSTFSKYNVDAVFSSSIGIFNQRKIDGVTYFITGGGGGLLNNNKNSFYHYVKVNVKGNNINYEIVNEGSKSNQISKIFWNIWIYLHSLFYINMANFLLILSILVAVGVLIYWKVTKEVDYYRDFTLSEDQTFFKDKLNIAMFTNNYFPFIGGVPISIYRLAKGLQKKGHSVTIFAPKYPNSNIEEEHQVIRCNLLTYFKTKKFDFAIVNIFSPKIEQRFREGNFDVIHAHHPFWMGKKGLRLGKKYNIPVVFTYHTRLDMYSHYIPFLKLLFKNILSHKIIKRFCQRCKAVFAPTTTAREYLENIGVSRRIEVMPTGCDFDVFDKLKSAEIKCIREKYVKEDELLFCSVSRLSKEKNIYFLLNSLKFIKDHTNQSFQCLIIGDGPEKNRLFHMINDLGLQNMVHLIGAVPPEVVNKYYLASDLFLFSSTSETQGMVLLEAMAGKCPVVAVASSGIQDVVINDYNGFKTPENIEKWSDKVIYLMNNREQLRKMSNNALQLSKEYSLDGMADKANKVYLEAIEYQYAFGKRN